MTRTPSTAEKLGAWIGIVYLVTLWAETILYADILERPFEPSDVVVVVGCLWLLGMRLPSLWRGVLREPIVWATALVAASMVGSTLAAGDGLFARASLRCGLQLALVICTAEILGIAHARAQLAAWVVRLAKGFVAVGLVGGLCGALGLLDFTMVHTWRYPFVELNAHPVLGEIPRFIGGLGAAVELAGIWAVAALCVLASASGTRLRASEAGWSAAAALFAVLTFSLAVASAVIAVPLWLWQRRARRLAALALVAALLAFGWVQLHAHHGHSDLGPHPCDAVFPNNWLKAKDASSGLCELVRNTDGSVASQYLQAKRASLAIFEAAPWLGVGGVAFERTVKAGPASIGGGTWNPYLTTHGIVHGVAAEQGLLGLLAYAALALAVFLALRRARREHPRAVAALALFFVAALAMGVSLDVHKNRLLWIAVGAAAGLALAARRDRADAGEGRSGH